MEMWTMRKAILFILALTAIGFAQDKVDVTPKFYGYVRNWYQADLAINQGAFLIKEARLGVRGNVNEYASYKLYLDLTRLGKLSTTSDTVTIIDKWGGTRKISSVKSASASFSDYLLDAEATITPMKSLYFTVGQFTVPISTENIKGGAEMEFVNRGLHFTNVTPELRDIGGFGSYSFNPGVPVQIIAGAVNGSGQNKGEDDRTSNFFTRGSVTPIENFNIAANYYRGRLSLNKVNILVLGADFKIDKFSVTGEFATRGTETAAATVNGNGFYVYGLYDFDLGTGMISHILPAVRFDRFDPNTDVDKNAQSRITFGLSVDFAKIKYAQFRLNYEKWNLENGAANPDKLVFQFLMRF